MATTPLLLLLLFFPFPSSSTPNSPSPNPFTEKAALIRYWNRKIPNNLPHPTFFLSKLTPLSITASTTFQNLASTNPTLLSAHLPSFCSSAKLLCPSSPNTSLSSSSPSAFKSYENSNFTNYVSNVNGGVSSFNNYSDNLNVPVDTFRRYNPHSVFNTDKFTSYAPNGNVVTANFTSYGTSSSVGGSEQFASYDESSNVPDLKFTNYASDGTGQDGNFKSYSVNANAGDQAFSSYAKRGNGELSEFSSYANNSNVVGNTFGHYSEGGNGGNSTFSSYGENGNVPENNFKAYGESTNGGFDRFTSYRDQSNVGDSFFSSYEKSGNDGTADFTNYGNSANPGSDNFKGYAEGSYDDQITFKEYFADNTTFKSYANTSVIDFKGYHNSSTTSSSLSSTTTTTTTTATEKWIEPGKFFRERSLRKGVVMPMPDIRDRTAPRSFLPRSISGKIPFSAAAVDGIFRILPDTAMGKAVESTVADCERPPSSGETKRCAASAEDMIDFAVAVLGGDIQVRSTAAVTGSKNNILIGNVRGVNGGKVTESVSCHQSLFPYLVYYCHSVPRVRVYVADILAVDSKEKINEGVAICHLDTSDWSAGHGAFVALGPGPGKIEVCHWIFEGDMTWTIADRT